MLFPLGGNTNAQPLCIAETNQHELSLIIKYHRKLTILRPFKIQFLYKIYNLVLKINVQVIHVCHRKQRERGTTARDPLNFVDLFNLWHNKGMRLIMWEKKRT